MFIKKNIFTSFFFVPWINSVSVFFKSFFSCWLISLFLPLFNFFYKVGFLWKLGNFWLSVHIYKWNNKKMIPFHHRRIWFSTGGIISENWMVIWLIGWETTHASVSVGLSSFFRGEPFAWEQMPGRGLAGQFHSLGVKSTFSYRHFPFFSQFLASILPIVFLSTWHFWVGSLGILQGKCVFFTCVLSVSSPGYASSVPLPQSCTPHVLEVSWDLFSISIPLLTPFSQLVFTTFCFLHICLLGSWEKGDNGDQSWIKCVLLILSIKFWILPSFVY